MFQNRYFVDSCSANAISVDMLIYQICLQDCHSGVVYVGTQFIMQMTLGSFRNFSDIFQTPIL